MSKILIDYLNQYHTMINIKSKGFIDITKNLLHLCVDDEIDNYLEDNVKFKKSNMRIVVADYSNNLEILRLLNEKNYKEAVKLFRWVCADESKLDVLKFNAGNKKALQSAMDIIVEDYFRFNELSDLEKNIERIVISQRQKEISNKRKKHPFYEESIRKAKITWEYFPAVSYARMAKALDSFFGDGVSREAIEGWLKDAKLRPEVPVRKTSFSLMG